MSKLFDSGRAVFGEYGRTLPSLSFLGLIALGLVACQATDAGTPAGHGGSGATTGGSGSGGTGNGGSANGGTAQGGAAQGGAAQGGAAQGGAAQGGAAQGGAAQGGASISGGAAGSAGASAGSGGVAGSAGGAANAGSTNGGSTSGGAAGANAGGAAGNAGATQGGAASADCSTLPLCDTFESTAVGAAPDSKLWTLIPTGTAGTATVDAMGAHGSAHSLKVVSPDRLYLRNSSVIGTLGALVHVRFYVRFGSALAQGHGALIVTHPTAVDQYSQSNELRFGSQDNVFHWNTDSDAANIPDVSPNGDAASFKPAANTWYCVELTINTNGTLSASIDGTDVPGLTEDGVATPNIDQSWVGSTASLSRYTMLADFNFGWQSYGAGALTAWFDDVALSKTHIGCQ
jgi:hypothetical protein